MRFRFHVAFSFLVLMYVSAVSAWQTSIFQTCMGAPVRRMTAAQKGTRLMMMSDVGDWQSIAGDSVQKRVVLAGD